MIGRTADNASMSVGAPGTATAPKLSSYQRRGMDAARRIIGATDVRGFAAGRVEIARMTEGTWWVVGIFGAVFVFFFLVLHVILLPGALVFVLVYESVKPRRGVVVTGNGIVEFTMKGFNALPKSVMATTDYGALYQGRARSVGKGIGITFGSETVIVRERDYPVLLGAVPPVPVPGPVPSPWAAGGVAASPPIPPPPVVDDLPRWRRASVGWVLAHFFVACAALVAVLAVSSPLVELFHHDPNHPSPTAVNALWLVFAMLLAGWYVFVYLRSSFRTRVNTLVACWGGALIVTCVANIVFSPVVPN